MREGEFLDSDRAVSEVMGEVILVGISVVVVSVLAAQAMSMWAGIGGAGVQSSLVIADADGDYPNQAITIDHKGGDPVPPAETRIVVRDVEKGTVNATLEYDGSTLSGDGLTAHLNGWGENFSTEATPSDTINIAGGDGDRLTDRRTYEVILIEEESGIKFAADTITLR